MILIVASLLVAFLLGSIPFGLLVSRVFKVGDIRTQGSGNIGATNVTRIAGFWPAGFLTLLFDVLKGYLAVLIFKPIGFEIWSEWFQVSEFPANQNLFWAIGLSAIVGHCFSPWLRGSGGKGVATFYGVVAAMTPVSGLIGLTVFAWVFYTRKIGSLASLASVGTVFLAEYVLPGQEESLAVIALICVLIVVRHEKNIRDLLEDRERSF